MCTAEMQKLETFPKSGFLTRTQQFYPYPFSSIAVTYKSPVTGFQEML